MADRFDILLTVSDTRAQEKVREFRSLGIKGLTDVKIVDSYITDAKLSAEQRKQALSALVNKNLERGVLNGMAILERFSTAIEIGYLPGVTDNIGATAKETIEDATGKKFPEALVSAVRVYALYGKLSAEDIEKITRSLYNPLIERAIITTWNEFQKNKGFARLVPRVSLHAKAEASIVSLDVSDEELLAMGTAGIKNTDGTRRGPLALTLKDMQTIRDHFKKEGRNPTDIEIESIAQTWSEHCKHRIFASAMPEVPEGIYKGFIKRATVEIRKKKGKKDFCVSVFSDNSGIIELDKDWLVSHKVETHNSPSALDPFGGAITGIVGVNRDAIGTGMGAKPVANIYGFCVGMPDDTRPLYRDPKQKEKMLSPRRILDGVVKGVNHGGNASGIPTVHGFLLAEDRYRGKPLVFAGTIGLLPRTVLGKNSAEKSARPGDLVVVIGNRVGLDGIHGATFSSVALDEGSPATAVQIGDPITQKKFSDMIVKEARDMGLYRSITDNGAGGISCSVPEMARESGGCRVDLEKVPVKYPGLAPWQIWISESQERITLAVPKASWKKLEALCKKRGVEASVIGEFTKSGRSVVSWKGKVISDLSLEFLHNGWPRDEIVVKEPSTRTIKTPAFKKLDAELFSRLSDPSIASSRFIPEQYDHEVQAGSVMKPLQGRGRVPAPSAVFRPVLSSKAGVLVTSALYPTYSDVSAYSMAASGIDTAIRQAIAGGAPFDKIALLDNFCWSKSNTPESMYELRDAARACYETAVAYEAPFISGKDSMHNDFKGFDQKGKPVNISIPPTLLISAMAVMPDALSAVSLDFKKAGDKIYLIGETHGEFSAPEVEAKKWSAVYKKYAKASKYTNAGHALSHGGLAVGLSKMAIAGKLGFNINLSKVSGSWQADGEALFSESQGRIVAVVSSQNASTFEKALGASAVRIGSVTEGEVVIQNGKKMVLETKVEKLAQAFEKTYKNF